MIGSLASVYDCAETIKVSVLLNYNKHTNNNKTKNNPRTNKQNPTYFAYLITPVAGLPTLAVYLVYFELYSAMALLKAESVRAKQFLSGAHTNCQPHL